MGLSNLPPGVTENMLPGSTPEDEWWEKVVDLLPMEVGEAMHDPAHEFYEKLSSFTESFDRDYNPDEVADKILTYFEKLKKEYGDDDEEYA